MAGTKLRCPSCQRLFRLAIPKPLEIQFEVVADEQVPNAGGAAAPPDLPQDAQARRKKRRGSALPPTWRAAISAGLLVILTAVSAALAARFDRVDYRPPTLVGKWKAVDMDVTFHFQPNGTATYSGSRQILKKIGLASSGPWEIVGREGETLKIRMGPPEQLFAATLVFDDPDTFSFTQEFGDRPDPILFGRLKK
jgi:hypothetical protein